MWSDIDYMDNYIDFTIDHNKWKDLPAFVNTLHSEGRHFVPIIDAGISIADDSKKNNYFGKGKQ